MPLPNLDWVEEPKLPNLDWEPTPDEALQGTVFPAIQSVYSALTSPAVAEASQMGRRAIAREPLLAEKRALERSGLAARAGVGAAEAGEFALRSIAGMNPADLARKVINPSGATIVPPEVARRAVEFMDPLGVAPVGSARSGAEEFLAETGSGLTAPDAVAALLAARYAPVSRPYVGRYFQLPMVAQSGEAAGRLAEAQTPAELVKSGLETALTVGGPLGIEAGLRPRPTGGIPLVTGAVLKPTKDARPTPLVQQLLREGMSLKDANDLIAGKRTPQQVAEDNILTVTPQGEGSAHRAILEQGFPQAVARINAILGRDQPPVSAAQADWNRLYAAERADLAEAEARMADAQKYQDTEAEKAAKQDRDDILQRLEQFDKLSKTGKEPAEEPAAKEPEVEAPKVEPSKLDQLRAQAAKVLVETRGFDPDDAATYAARLGGEKELARFLADNTPEALAALEREAPPAAPTEGSPPAAPSAVEARPAVPPGAAVEPAISQAKPEISETQPAKEPWQMTSKEYGAARYLEVPAVRNRDGTVLVAGRHEPFAKSSQYFDENGFFLSRNIPEAAWGVDMNGAKSIADQLTLPESSGLFVSMREVDSAGGDTHKAAIAKLVREGKPVPQDVLAEYPDLAPKEPWQMTKAEYENGPPVKEGYVRLWRGEYGDTPSKPSELEGRWFSTSRETADFFASLNPSTSTSRIVYVDIPSKDLAKYDAFNLPESQRPPLPDEQAYVLPPELAAKKQHWVDYHGDGHGDLVASAVESGKPVPPEVLADYPDLSPKPQPPAAEGGKAEEVKPADVGGRLIAVNYRKLGDLPIKGAKRVGEKRFGGVKYWSIPESELANARKLGATLNRDLTASLIQPTEPPPTVTPAAEKVQAEVQKVAAVEGQRPAKEVKKELVSELEKALESAKSEKDYPLVVQQQLEIAKKGVDLSGRNYQYGKHGDALRAKDYAIEKERIDKLATDAGFSKITIQIPGDGEFTVWNTKESIQTMLDAAKSIKTKSPKRPEEIGPGRMDAAAYLKRDISDAVLVYGDKGNAYRKLSGQLEHATELDLPDEQVARLKKLTKALESDVQATWKRVHDQMMRVWGERDVEAGKDQLHQNPQKLSELNKRLSDLQETEKAELDKMRRDLGKLPWEKEPTPAPAQKEIVGMGGAVPGEFEGQADYVSNMFAAIDRDRLAMGKPPMAEGRKRTWDEDNQRALAQMNRDPNWIPNLIQSVLKNPRPLLSWENAGLVWHRAKLKAEANNAYNRINKAFEDGRGADLAQAKTDAAVFEDQLEGLDRAVGRGGTGSEAGRTLQAQKMGAGDDFTLVEMVMQKRAAVGGRKLTDAEYQQLVKSQKELETTRKAYDDYLASSAERIRKLELDNAMKQSALDAKKPDLPYSPGILQAAERLAARLDKSANDALARFKARNRPLPTDPTSAHSGFSAEDINDLSIYVASKVARGMVKGAAYTAHMIEVAGEGIKAHLDDIWTKASSIHDAEVKKAGQNPLDIARAIKEMDPAQRVAHYTEEIKQAIGKKENEKLGWLIRKIARELYKQGVTERDEMVQSLHQIVSPLMGPEWKLRDTADAFSGYGAFKPLTKDKISLELRGMKGELQQLAKLEDMAAGQPPLKSGLERRTPTEVERQLIKRVNDAKYKFQVPISDPNTQLKSALDTLKTTLQNRITDYEDRLRRGDFTARPRREVVLDDTAARLKAQAERVKKRYQEALMADRMKHRTPWEKILDWGTKFRRFTALSSPVVIPKLLGAAGWRAFATAAEDISGGALAAIPGIRSISARAPVEGAGGQLKATLKGYGAAFTRGLEDAANVIRTGHSDIDVLYGKAHESYTGEFEMASKLLNFPGRVHGMIKAPVKRGAYEKTVQRLAEYYARQGLDITSEPVKLRIAMEAYKAGNRAIFLQDNRISSGFTAALMALERKGESGHPAPGGKVLATIARFMFPVTRVPTNIAAETVQYAGGLPTGLLRAANAIRKGLDTLTPDQADLIMRELKKGSIGMAALFLGYMGYQQVGGVYEQGQKRKPADIKPDAARLFGVDIPGNLLHHPVINTIQLGATVHRTAEEKLRKKDPEAQGLTAGLMAASWGLADEVPFIQGPHRLFGGLADPYTRERTFGNEVGSVAIPQAVAWLAQVLDQRREHPPTSTYDRITGPPARLKPTNLWQTVETRIPGLRQNVPAK